jgi:hypothetical protein
MPLELVNFGCRNHKINLKKMASRGKYKTNIWKERLCKLQKENSNKDARIKRFEKSMAKLKAENKKLKKGKKEGSHKAMAGQVFDEKAKGHQYAVQLVTLCVQLQVSLNLSLRQVTGVVSKMLLLFALEMKAPSYGTVRNWVRKAGYYKFMTEESLNDASERWVLITDESASIGRDKALLILGVPLSKYEFGESLSQKDVICLSMQSTESWTKQGVIDAFGAVEKRLAGEIIYTISDRAVILTGACKAKSYKYVPDITHYLASIVEGYYSKCSIFKDFMSKMAKVRQKWIMSKNCALVPPNMRTKARFLNLFDVVDWLEKIDKKYSLLNMEQQEELNFIKENSELHNELKQIITWIRNLCKNFKNNGIDKDAIKLAENIMADTAYNNRGVDFKNKVLEYFQMILDLLPNEQKIICCSDIIESFFGKFKYRKTNAAKGISDDLLAMPLFDDKLNAAMMKKALEEFTLSDIKEWAEEYTVPTLRKIQFMFWRNLLSETG